MDNRIEQLERMKINELRKISRQLAEINKTLRRATDTPKSPYQVEQTNDEGE